MRHEHHGLFCVGDRGASVVFEAGDDRADHVDVHRCRDGHRIARRRRRREGGLGVLEQAVHPIGVAGQRHGVGVERAEQEIGANDLDRQLVERATQRRELRRDGSNPPTPWRSGRAPARIPNRSAWSSRLAGDALAVVPVSRARPARRARQGVPQRDGHAAGLRTAGGSGTTDARHRGARSAGWTAPALPSMAWPSVPPVSASHSGPVSRSSTDVLSTEIAPSGIRDARGLPRR